MRQFVISELFFKTIAERGKLYSRIWVYWLSEFVDELFEPDFIEKQEIKLKQYKLSGDEIREMYQCGIQLLQQDFKVIEERKKKPIKQISKENRKVSELTIEYLNSKCGTTFSNNGNNLELITSRISEGFSISDFKCVIDKKVLDWKGTDWEKYLRPNTLFSKTKFENYLNSINEPNKKRSDFDQFASSVQKAKKLAGFHTK